MVIIRYAEEGDVRFLLECISHNHEINDHYFVVEEWTKEMFGDIQIDLSVIKKYLNPKYPEQPIIIVNNGTKDIGFFSQDLDMQNMHLGTSAYVHPKSCKMSILKVIKACTIRGILYGLRESFIAVEFNTYTPLITSIVKSIIPSIKEHKINDSYRICYVEFKKVQEETSYAKFLEDMKLRFEVSLYNENESLFTFKDK